MPNFNENNIENKTNKALRVGAENATGFKLLNADEFISPYKRLPGA